jgi:putative membrane protein
LLGIEEIGNEIEDPFGVDPNDLPVDGICQTVLDNIEELTATTGAEEAEVKLALDVG